MTVSAWIKKYGVAFLSTGAAWLGDILLRDYLDESSATLFISAALVSAWYGGWGPGLVAVLLTVAINFIFYDLPYLSLAVGTHGFERLIVSAGVSVLVVWLTARSRRTEKSLQDLNHNLAAQVQKRTSALARSNQELEAFCYTLAHDLRSPLRAVQGYAHLLFSNHSASLDAEGKIFVEHIRNSAERMGLLIMDLLAYTDLARTTSPAQAVDLETVTADVLRIFTDEIQRTRAEVSVELTSSEVLGDRAGVERVLANVLGNALKFVHPERPPRIRIFTERHPGLVRVCVEDNGLGLDPQYSEHIFGVFQRLQGINGSSGTGMGLAMARRSVEKMGGRIGVQSVPGEGSRFWFELPEIPKAAGGSSAGVE